MAAGDRWVEAAMSEDALVADLLLRMHLPSPSTPHPAVNLEWRVRQRRSKSAAVNEKRKRVSLLASPNNPLSWSGATSVSGGSGSEESTRSAPRDRSVATRSKNSSVAHSERNNSSKRPRKKTLAELKDEESSLLKERRVLEREMAAMRSNLERRRAENEKIKRAKIEFMRSTEEDSVKFALPDLNVPFDEHTSDVACGC